MSLDTRVGGPTVTDVPVRPISYARAAVRSERGTDGATRLSAEAPLESYEPSLARLFRAAVDRQPQRVFLAERLEGVWRTLTYEQARAKVDALATALLARELSPDRPVLILAGNSIDHALLTLAGYTAGVPVAPASAAYSLQSQDFGKLRHVAELLTPGMIYVDDAQRFGPALAALEPFGAEIVASRGSANVGNVTLVGEMAATPVGPAVDRAAAAIRPDTIAKLLFTSGSTGLPKGVINTHRMLTANQQQAAQIWPFCAEQPFVLVDWLPWSHTFGGNHNFNMVMRHAGTLYIDGGRPVPTMIGETVRNLTDVSPTVYFNVPAGYAALLPFLEADSAFARSFFKDLRVIVYAGAALPQDIWGRLEAVAVRTVGERIPMTSSWGTTETAPMATSAHFAIDRAGVVGVPVPGIELKLVPSGSKLEVRVRGPNVTPGYWKRPELTAAAFDEEGFYRPGDAMRFVDTTAPSKGLVFDGRIAEDFKLTTGTWVHVGAVRVGLLGACSPVLQDAIVAGENRECLGVLVWVNVAGCARLIVDEAPVTPDQVATNAVVRRHIEMSLRRWNADHPGSSERIARAMVLLDPPSIDTGEITDKGYVNQRLALERRAADVARLFAAEPDEDVILVESS